jgi:hypothetical protein
MQKLVLAGVLAASLTAPVASYAQTAAPAASAPVARVTVDNEVFTIKPAQWLAVGAGVIVGAAVLDVVLPSNIAFVLGGVVGGYLANAWYSGREVQLQLNAVPKS